MANRHKDFLDSCVLLMLRPLVDFCVARGIRFQDFVELSKQSFVASARTQLLERDSNLSHSRLSAMTGLQRLEIKRLLDNKVKTAPKDIVTRLLGQWERDRRFLDRSGHPKPLLISGPSSEFKKLVRSVSKDLNHHTVKLELERLGLIEISDEKAKLLHAENIVRGDPLKAFQFASEDVHDLLTAVEENAFLSATSPNLHARTQYDNIPERYVPKIKDALLRLGHRFHARARSLISAYDRDINPSLGDSGGGRYRVVIGTFSRAHEFKEDEEQATEGESK